MADACPCGCRLAGFSDELIRQRGIYAQLIQVPSNTGQITYRHVHPTELALLNGFLPPSNWLESSRPSLKLCLCAVGQLASPLQAIWIGGQTISHLQRVFGLSPVDPSDMLTTYRRKLFQVAQDVFHESIPAQLDTPGVEVRHLDGSVVQIAVQASSTLAQLCRAEVELTHSSLDGQWCDAHTGQPLNWDEQVAGRCIRVIPHSVDPSLDSATKISHAHDPASVVDIPLDLPADVQRVASEASEAGCVSVEPEAVPVALSKAVDDLAPTVPSVASGSAVYPAGLAPDVLLGLKSLSGSQLAALLPPLVRDHQACLQMRQAVVSNVSRLELLHRQRSAMGDDELNLHVQACLALAANPQIHYLDPLLATTWLKVGTPEDVTAWISRHPHAQCIVTAVLVQDHWVAVMWTKGLKQVHASLWEHTETNVDCLCPLHGLVSSAWGCPNFVTTCNRRSFSRDYCGTAAVAYLAHKLIDSPLPQSEAELIALHQSLRNSFAQAVHDMHDVPKPWCWGLGTPDVVALTASLLQVHGVPFAQVQTRAKLVVQSLGRGEVQKAVTGVSPWKSLKALANLQSLPLQLVMPDEVSSKAIAKQSAAAKTPASAKKSIPSRPMDFDPTKLLLDQGAFCTGNDEPLAQIPFSTLGPLAKGVALTTHVEAMQFLTSGKLLTHQSLALLIVNPPGDLQTPLQWSSLRFAVRCSVNQEPMILPGILVQLGHQLVYQFRSKDAPAVSSVEVACARVTVFRDQLEMAWEEFAARPVKHVVSMLPCLKTCQQHECTCPAWHPVEAQPPDALLDVFRRQFVVDSGKPVQRDKATAFTVLFRYVKGLEPTVLAASGHKGLFVEPKTEDAMKPHPDYQVIWLPQLDFAAVSHKAQCEVHCVGLARTARRFGIRVHVTNFPQVFASVKPDAVYLAPGSRQTYHCGPWPYGTDRKNLAKLLKASGWECRPLQPLHSVPGGLMWSIQSVTAPPSNILSLQHGQVMITSQDTKPVGSEGDAVVVGPAKTVQLCLNSDAGAVADPWLTNDPWKKAASVMPAPPQLPAPASALQEIEDRLEQNILAKLPAHHAMEVDDQDSRLVQLEQQFQQLATRQSALESTVAENHTQSTVQVQNLQQQMMVQLDLQSKQMQGMLTDQMARIETILAKKPRTE